MLDICTTYKIDESEFAELDHKFGRLIWHAAHELKKKNTRNNFIEDIEDIKQELQMSMLRAGSYYKRQVYIEKCFNIIKKHVQNNFLKLVVEQLEDLWFNRTRHGANRQKYGLHQEKILDTLIKKVVPKLEMPDKNAPLKIDSKFATYCKAIVWNGQKSMGKKITREKSIRTGLVSLSEFDYMGSK